MRRKPIDREVVYAVDMQVVDQPSVNDQERAIRCELRVNQAGQRGAVSFYRGMLATAKEPELRGMIDQQLAAEQRHLDFFNGMLPTNQRSRWQIVWHGFGWILGAWSSLMGSQSAYQTIDALETFVRRHYQQQLLLLRAIPAGASVAQRLQQFELEEVDNRDEIRDRLLAPPNWRIRTWHRLIDIGSRIGVAISRRI